MVATISKVSQGSAALWPPYQYESSTCAHPARIRLMPGSHAARTTAKIAQRSRTNRAAVISGTSVRCDADASCIDTWYTAFSDRDCITATAAQYTVNRAVLVVVLNV